MSNGSYDELKLGNQLCFPLYAASHKVIRAYKPFLDEIDLTYTQYIAMMVLWESRRVTVKELGERLFLDSGTLTPLLKKLEAKGYITRTRGESDERQLIVDITEEGDALKERARSIPAALAGCVQLSAEEAAALYTLLYKILG